MRPTGAVFFLNGYLCTFEGECHSQVHISPSYIKSTRAPELKSAAEIAARCLTPAARVSASHHATAGRPSPHDGTG